jgi:MscS family membrane protein
MTLIANILGLRLAVLVMLALASLPAARAGAQAAYSDISVDRSTAELNLKTFLEAADRIALRLEAREWARNFYHAWLYPEISPEQAAETDLLETYMLDSMDLSAFPDWRRKSAGVETALMLRELLREEGVTQDTAFRKLRDGMWAIPGTYLQAGTITSGMRTGDVIFTADTVANIPALYNARAHKGGDAGFNVYRYVTETPGGLNPPRWAGITYKLPAFLRWSVGTNTVFQWGLSIIVIAAVVMIPWLVGKLIDNNSLRLFIRSLIAGFLSVNASSLIINDTGLSGPGATAVTLLFVAVYYGAMAVMVLILGEWIGNWVSRVKRAKDKSFDTSIVRLATRVVSVMTALAIVIYGISTMGVPVFGIIAGFGVGGLAVALAAKPTLENILAGVILFLDGSIKVGDEIESGSLSGVIEDIGMRSTRIRAADGGLISVTNAELANTVFKNVSKRVAGPLQAERN